MYINTIFWDNINISKMFPTEVLNKKLVIECLF
jgi:hypothetical protein